MDELREKIKLIFAEHGCGECYGLDDMTDQIIALFNEQEMYTNNGGRARVKEK